MIYSGIRGKLKGDGKFKYQTCANQQTDMTGVESFYCPGDKVGGRGGTVDEVGGVSSETLYLC